MSVLVDAVFWHSNMVHPSALYHSTIQDSLRSAMTATAAYVKCKSRLPSNPVWQPTGSNQLTPIASGPTRPSGPSRSTP